MKRLVLIVVLMVCCLAPIGQSAGQQPTFSGYIYDIEWSPDATKLIVVTSDGVWLVIGDDRFQFTSGHIDDVTWSPDGRSIALLRRVPYGIIEIWNLANPLTPQFLRSFKDKDMKGEDFENLDWSPISNLVVVRGVGIRIWNADNGELIQTLQSGEYSTDPQWSPDGSYILSFGKNPRVWSSRTWELEHDILFPVTPHFGSWGNDNQHIVVVESNPVAYRYVVYILDLTQPNLLLLTLPFDTYLTRTQWRGNTLASFADPGIAIWDVSTQSLIITISSGDLEFALSPDGSQIAYIQDDGILQIQTVNTPYVAPTLTTTPD